METKAGTTARFHQTRRRRCSRIEPSFILQHSSRRRRGSPAARGARRARAGQDLRAQALALGAADASAAEGDGGMGRLGREGVERHHQVQGVPVAAARQGVRPLRHGARRHRRPHLRQSGLSARPLPDHLGRRIAVPGRRRQGRHPGDRRLVPQVCRQRDEGREVLLLLHSRSADLAFEQEENRGAGRHQGNQGAAVASDGGGLGDAARRHQRAGERDRGPRRDGEGRGGGGHLPVGLGAAARRRQGHQVSHRRAAPHRHVPMADEPDAPMRRCRRRRRR